MRAGDQLDGVEAGAVHRLGDGQHHTRGHVLRPQALVAVTDRRVDEFDTVVSHCSKPRNLLTTKSQTRQGRNQSRNRHITTKVTKSTKFKSINIRSLRVLRALRGESVFTCHLASWDRSTRKFAQAAETFIYSITGTNARITAT